MNRVLLMFFACLLCFSASHTVDAQQMVYVVRHGEKLDDSKDPPLSPAGEARAARLAQMLAASGVKAIYTTQYRRTAQLAEPLARKLNVVPGRATTKSPNPSPDVTENSFSPGASFSTMLRLRP